MRPYETPVGQALTQHGGRLAVVVDCGFAARVCALNWLDPENLPCVRAPFPFMWFEFKVPVESPLRIVGEAVGVRVDATAESVAMGAVLFDGRGDPVGGVRSDTLLDVTGRAVPGTRLTSSNGVLNPANFAAEEINGIFAAFAPAWYALSMMHCKNVRLVEESVPHGIVRKRRRQGIAHPLVKFSRIVVDRQATRGAKLKTGDHGSAFHFCRGHFRTYTEAKPAFGSVAGTWWIPHHARGDIGHGVVTQQYSA